MQIWELFEEWMLEARARNLSRNTLAYYRLSVRRFVEVLEASGRSTDGGELSAGDFRRFIVESSERYAP